MRERVNKAAIVEWLIADVQAGLERLKTSFENVRQAAIEAPGRMQSRYDTTKEEQGKLADAIGTQVLELERALRQLQAIRAIAGNSGDTVAIGSLVTVAATYGEDRFFVVPAGGGRTLEFEGFEITAVSANAPIASALLGHKAGDSVEFQLGSERRSLTIRNVE